LFKIDSESRHSFGIFAALASRFAEESDCHVSAMLIFRALLTQINSVYEDQLEGARK
jgi:hypothetical protein